MKTIRATIIGESNSVMEPGYVSAAIHACRSLGIELACNNLSVGGTASLCGLFQLKALADLQASDILITAYCLNDASFYGEDRKSFRVWARTYEGVIRHAKEVNPRLQIINLIVPPQNGVAVHMVPILPSGIYYINDWYGVHTLNIAKEIIQQYGRNVLLDPGLYMDMVHFSRPVGTGILGRMLADRIVRILGEEACASSVPPIDEGNYAGASVLDVTRIAGAPVAEYKNSRYSAQASVLNDKALHFTLDSGRLLGICYICDENTTELNFRFNGKALNASMMKSGVAGGRFRFLRSMLNCDFLYGADVNGKPDTAAYEISANKYDGERHLHVPKESVPAFSAAPEASVAIVGLLHSGTAQDVRFEACAKDPRPA